MSCSPSPGAMDRARHVLATVFGHPRLTEVQAAALPVVLSGRDAIIVGPTGGGKSLCYQVPAVCAAPPSLTVVVSPLVALMSDQVTRLTSLGIAAAAVHAGQPAGESRAALHAAERGQLRLLHVSPERLVGAPDLRAALGRAPVDRVVVDEAHCVVRWGRDFRPDYLALAEAFAALGRPQLVALTATATSAEQAEILQALDRPAARRVVVGFDRPGLYFAVRATPTWSDKLRAVVATARQVPGPMLIYTATRGESDWLARTLARRHRLPAASYHAGLAAPIRAAVQAAFMADRLRVVVATAAFGMGVDKPGIRSVIHWSPPASLTDYVQAAGRAGRDGDPALALLLVAEADRRWREAMLAEPAPTLADLSLTCLALGGHATAHAGTHPEAIAARTGLSPRRVRAGLALLHGAGVARPVGGAAGSWILVRAPAAAELATLAGAAEGLGAARRVAFSEVARYAAGDACRRKVLAARFGAAEPQPRPDCCDVCGRTARPAAGWGRGAPPVAHSSEASTGPSRDARDAGRADAVMPFDLAVLEAVAQGGGHASPWAVARAVARSLALAVAPAAAQAALARLGARGLVVVDHADTPARWALTRRGRACLASAAASVPVATRGDAAAAIDADRARA